MRIAPLLMGLAFAGLAPATAQPAPATVTILLESHRFVPRVLTLAGGVPVRLRFVNRAGKTHDFTAPTFFAAARSVSGPVRNGRVRLRGGESAEVVLTPTTGRYRLHCARFGHAPLGMTGTIEVR